MRGKLIAASVVRGSQRGESHGGVYLIDLINQEVTQTIDWNRVDIDWQGRGWDRGLRGIAFDAGTVYLAASDELFAYTPDFERIGSWKTPYLKHCHEIYVYEREIFLTSTGCDSILAFDLDKREFHWGLHIKTTGFSFDGTVFDPRADKGPLMLNKMHINNVFCDSDGMYISGAKTGGMLHFNGHMVYMSVALPEGIHNARPFRNGVLFNDTQSDAIRYCSRSGEEDRVFSTPKFNAEELLNKEMDVSRIARQGFGRGLCCLSDSLIVGGSSPSTIAIHDLEQNLTALTINLSMDIRNTIHGLEVWPYD